MNVSGTSSPRSMHSAATRKASVRTAVVAASRVELYVTTPGIHSMSAQKRPSFSRPTLIAIASSVTNLA